jgi:Zn-finger nucleic acid-binding protein
MECPACHAQFGQINFKGVLLDECPKCKGRWFDRGELKEAKDRTVGHPKIAAAVQKIYPVSPLK